MFRGFLTKYFPLIWFSIVPLLASAFIGYFSFDWVVDKELTLAFIFGLYVLVSGLMSLGVLPTTFVAILTGFIGGWKLLPFMILSYVVASFIGYLIGLKTNKDYWLNLLKGLKRGEDLITNAQDKSRLFVFSCRLSPLFPFGISNIAFAILGVPIKRFLVWGTIGMLPRTLLSIWLGIQAEDFSSALIEGRDLPVFQMATVLLIFLSTVVIIRVFFKRNHN